MPTISLGRVHLRSIAVTVSMLLVLLVGQPSAAMADQSARLQFANFYVLFWQDLRITQKSMACRAYEASPSQGTRQMTTFMMGEFNSYIGPKLKPPVRITYTDASFVTGRALKSDCSVSGRRRW